MDNSIPIVNRNTSPVKKEGAATPKNKVKSAHKAKNQQKQSFPIGVELSYSTEQATLKIRTLVELNATERAILDFTQALDPYGDRFVKIGQICKGEPVPGRKRVAPIFLPVLDIPCLRLTAQTFKKALSHLEYWGYVAHDPERSPGVWLKNLHGYRCKSVPLPPHPCQAVLDYTAAGAQKTASTKVKMHESNHARLHEPNQTTHESNQALHEQNQAMYEPNQALHDLNHASSPKTLTQSGSDLPSRSTHEVLTNPSRTPQGGSEGVSILPKETPQTPLRGAGATNDGRMQEKDVPPSHSPLVPDKSEEAREESINSDGGESSGAGIARQPNSYQVGIMSGDRECDDEVGHADIVATICERVSEYYYRPEEWHRALMMQLTISKLQELSERFQKAMNQSMSLPSRAKTKLAFEFALGLAYGKPLPRN